MSTCDFKNKIVVLGYGSIAKAVLPLIPSHFSTQSQSILVVARDIPDPQLIEQLGFSYQEHTLTKTNYQTVLDDLVMEGDLLVNLTAEVSSLDLMQYCTEHNVLYLDTCIELWADEIDPDSKTYDERELLLKLQRSVPPQSSTALSSMGANPGLVSLLTKRLLLLIAHEVGVTQKTPQINEEWALLAKELTVRIIHINERDTQYTSDPVTANDFLSTWSVEAMIMESIEAAEMSIGSHEEVLPNGAHYSGKKNRRDIYFDASGKDVQIKTWLPQTGEQYGMVLNHNEPMSIAELYSK
ncbi:MAG: saccharopine dehydrogenase NADP-binding domain-containing protein [Candidatus Paceibacterota bacterium]